MKVDSTDSPRWQPIPDAERCTALDVVRGVALLGVLLVNLHCSFRVSLAEHLLTFHSSPWWADRAADVVIAGLLEFKAFTLFSLLFGAGVAVFGNRAAHRGASPIRFLARRLVVLLALGLAHMLVVWNGDILTLYAVCGLLMIPFSRLHAVALASAGAAAFTLPYVIPWGLGFPSEGTLQKLAKEATRVYYTGDIGDVTAFHWHVTRLLILPLVVAVLPRTWGLMAIGAAAWKSGVFRDPNGHRRLLWWIALVGGGIGGAATLLMVYAASTGQLLGFPPALVEAASSAPLALSYLAGLLLILRSPSSNRLAAPFAAAGQMALTNYLAQSLVLSLLFYGYGLGLYGRLGSLAAIGVGLAVYSGQVLFSSL